MKGSKMARLILASASPRRAELLRQLNLDFEVVVSNAPEEIPAEPLNPGQLVMDLAARKVREAAENTGQDAVLIGADTVVALEDRILGKPADSAAAMAMLADLSGKKHRVFTGLALYQPLTARLVKDFAMTEVRFRELSRDEIAAYVRTGEPLDKAGAYGIQGLGAALVEGINGCYFNVVGLPLSKLVMMLKVFEVTVWNE
jgi:septum formation protein